MSEVMYGILDEANEMPQSGLRPSPLNAAVDAVIADPSKHRKAVCIAAYTDKGQAGAAAASLRVRFGRNINVKGLEFASRKVSITDPETGQPTERPGLWVFYDPDAIMAGAWEDHQKIEREKRNLANAKQREKARDKKESETGKPVKARK